MSDSQSQGIRERSILTVRIGLPVILALILLISMTALVQAQLQRALTQNDLIQLLDGGVYNERVATLVHQRGITFVPNNHDLDSLQDAGATKILLQAVLTAHRVVPRRELPASTKTIEVQQKTQPNPAAPLPVQVAAEPEVAPGSQVNMQNWRQYQKYMPAGMIELFKGNQFWKMPEDIELDVGPTVLEDIPRGYAQATEQYSRQVRVVHYPDGRNDILNYYAGEPFPNPQEPDKGYKLLADLWFAYVPHLAVGAGQNLLNTCTQDRLGYMSCLKLSYVYRQTAYNTDPGIPRNEPLAKDVWYTEWVMVEQPEQAKYTTQLTLFFKDNQRNQDLYIYLPSLRLTIRGSLASRCSPVVGTDYVQDDYKSIGFNGGVAIFDAHVLSSIVKFSR
jgi:hypothetical protein